MMYIKKHSTFDLGTELLDRPDKITQLVVPQVNLACLQNTAASISLKVVQFAT